MAFPKVGMHYEDVRRRVKRIEKTNTALVDSLLNQAERHEAGARTELERELRWGRRRSFSGSGNKQIGIGDGKKLGEGKYTFKDGLWEPVV